MKISRNVIKVEIESVGKEIDYGTSEISRTMRLLTVKDDSGNEFKAMALGKITKDLSKGKEVYVTKSRSPNPDASFNNYFVIKTA
jgi:hypothetical protein